MRTSKYTGWARLRATFMAAVTPFGVELTPRSVEWTAVERTVFPAAWVLPAAVWSPSEASRALPHSLRDLAVERFEAPEKATWMSSVGDMVLEHRRRGGSRSALDALLAELKAERPGVHAVVAPLLAEVLVADALRRKGWDPDVKDRDDGVFFGPMLERNKTTVGPWKDQKGTLAFHQAATFIRADLDAILKALHDYPALARDPGTSYEKIDPRADTFVVGLDPQIGPFAALRLSIRSDLPFPFSHYDLDLGILHRLDAEKHLVTYVFSPSNDFYWLAGQDFHYPVRSAAGEWVGTLLVRISGFDLRGVPDGEDDRKLGTLTALGNIRRRAEALFTAEGEVPRTVDGALPTLHVLTR
ncbi:MAG: hypothetical protein JNL28_07505 [Planctomycetes bacterium]|nr:hypothetical protein [Planctomycetota bacterium]